MKLSNVPCDLENCKTIVTRYVKRIALYISVVFIHKHLMLQINISLYNTKRCTVKDTSSLYLYAGFTYLVSLVRVKNPKYTKKCGRLIGEINLSLFRSSL